MDITEARADFPITTRRAYLNAAAAAPLSNRVVGVVQAVYGDMQNNGRNNNPHRISVIDKKIRPDIASLIGAQASEIAFIKNTTEGLNIIAHGLDWKEGDNIVLANIEYPANVYCWLNLARQGVEVRWIDAKALGGRVTVDAIREACDARTKLVAVSTVQFLTGYRQDLELTGQFCKERGILLAYDSIQQTGAFPIDAQKHHFDFLATGGHKWLAAPLGTGFLYCRSNVLDRVHPAVIGPGSISKIETDIEYDVTALRADSRRFEEAVINIPGIFGLHAAVTTLLQIGVDNIAKHILEITAQAAEGLIALGYDILSPLGENERSGILTFRHPNIESETIRLMLESEGVDLSARNGYLRIAPHFYNDHDDIRRLLSLLPK